jgi:hypothetical protein
MINNGLDLEREKREQDGTEWTFGATSPICLAQIPAEERMNYLPKGEVQFGREDFMDCATRGLLNVLETKLNYLLRTGKLPQEQWFKDNGYITDNGFELSDRFTAIKSNTTQQGNSIKAPLDSIRKDGVIPKKLLPANNQMLFRDYHNKTDITDKMISLGQEFLKRLTINYEKVFENQFAVFNDILDVAGYAWSSPINGEYPRIVGAPNHVWMNIKPQYYAFDNYLDTVDGDFIKKLSPDYDFYDYGYRLIIGLGLNDNLKQQISLYQKIIELLKLYVSKFIKVSGEILSGIFLPKEGD